MELTSGFTWNIRCAHDRSSAKFRNAVLVTIKELAEDAKYDTALHYGEHFNTVRC
jgi:hypothetical protein